MNENAENNNKKKHDCENRTLFSKKIAKLIDVKSIVTLLLMLTLVFLVAYLAVTGKEISGDIFLLFSNCTTMIITYFFAKKTDKGEENEQK